jgi:uncharacterized protein (DUF302 family)
MPRHRIAPTIRFWRTGAIAVVMAALGGARIANAAPMESRTSRYGVTQTAERIEASARRHGLAVFASVVRADAPGAEGSAGDVRVLVRESSSGGTPVLMQGDGRDLCSEVPLRLELRRRADGASEVRFPAAAQGVPPEAGAEFAAEVAGLSGLVAEALDDV